MIMSLSPLDCDESGHVVRVDAPSDAKKKKKTRRGTRGARRTRNKWKPWSELTWEERRDLDAKGAAKPQQEHELVIVSKRKGGKSKTVVVPVAPRLTKASITEEREARTQAAKFEDQDVPDTIEELDEFFARASSEGSSSGDEFDDAFNECMSNDYEGLSKDQLIRLLLQRDQELEQLQSRLHATASDRSSTST
eukprot:m.35178 g.35178  ORF g.35178 m.35178 type:complete len:194 (+) comp12370_c1_seq5:126-707(+)